MEIKKEAWTREVTNWLHSLFIIPKKEEYVKDKHWLFEKKEAQTFYRLYIQSFWNHSLEKKDHFKINNLFNELEEANEDKSSLELRISSYWGYVDELSRFENIIKTKFKWKATTILDNNWLSCWAMIFLMWDERLVHKNSYIMFHYYSSWLGWKGWEIKDQAKFQEKYYESYFKEAMKPYFSNKEIEELLIWKDYWLDSKQMLKRWIATKII